MNLAPHVVRLPAALVVTALLGACSTPSWMPSWLGGKPGPAAEPAKLVEFTPTLTPRIAWRASVGSSRDAFLQPAVLENAIYAGHGAGAVVRPQDTWECLSAWRSTGSLPGFGCVTETWPLISSARMPTGKGSV